MGNECYLRLQQIISEFPHLYQFLDEEFIKKQSESKLKNHLLKRLNNERSSHATYQHLPTLENRLAQLTHVVGYGRLQPLLRRASDWDQYQETLAQIDITLWFKRINLLKEIEPELPHRVGNADILLSFSQQDFYCEITSFQSISKSIESKSKKEEYKIQSRLGELKNGQPWKTKENLEHELEVNRAVRNLLGKTKRQLSPNYPGILALETGKSAIFGFDVREIAQKLFPSRPQVTLIMLWSLENKGGGDSDLRWKRGNPNYCFINGGAKFREVGERLSTYLGLKGEFIGA